jgi:hypothetical protein
MDTRAKSFTTASLLPHGTLENFGIQKEHQALDHHCFFLTLLCGRGCVASVFFPILDHSTATPSVTTLTRVGASSLLPREVYLSSSCFHSQLNFLPLLPPTPPTPLTSLTFSGLPSTFASFLFYLCFFSHITILHQVFHTPYIDCSIQPSYSYNHSSSTVSTSALVAASRDF